MGYAAKRKAELNNDLPTSYAQRRRLELQKSSEKIVTPSVTKQRSLTKEDEPRKKFSLGEVDKLWKEVNKDNVPNAINKLADFNDVAGATMRATVFGDTEDIAGGKKNATTGNKSLDAIAKATGIAESFLIPSGEGNLAMNLLRKGSERVVEKVAEKTGSKVLKNKVIQKAAVGAVESAPYTAQQIGTQKIDTKEALKTAALNTVLGAAAEPVIMGAGKLFKGMKGAKGEVTPEVKKAAGIETTAKTQTVSAPIDAGKANLPSTVEKAPVTSQSQIKVTQYKTPNVINLQDYGDVKIIDSKNGFVKFQTRSGKPITIDENDFELLKTGQKPQYTQKVSVSKPMKGSEVKKEPIKPPSSSTVINQDIKIAERTKKNFEGQLTQLEQGIQGRDTANKIQYVKDKITEMDDRINMLINKTVPNKLIDTAKGSGQYTESVSQNIQGEHNIRSTSELVRQAEEIVRKNPEKAINMAKSKEMATDLSNEIAHQLIQKANVEGRFNDAIDLIEITAKKATETGRAEQALSLWGKLTPEGMQKYAQRVINQANQKFAKAKPKEYMQIVQEYKKLGINLQLFATNGRRADLSKVLRLSADDAKYINDQMVKIGQMAEGRAKTVEIAKTLDYISGKIPPTLSSQISTLQTMAQLLNPKTAIRNTLGNLGFAVIRNIAKVIGTPVDMLASLATKERTTALPNLITQAKGFKKGWGLGLEDALNGIDTSGLDFQFDLKQNRTFRSGFFGVLEKTMGIELKATDRAFYQSAFDDSLREQIKLAKVTQPTDVMIERAHFEGLYATFQDKNMVSNAFTGIKRAMNGGKEFGLGDVLLKYPKTPANLLMRGVEFSPLGVIKSFYELARPIVGKEFHQKEFVDSLSRAIVGGGLAFGAYSLYNVGILSGKRPKDKDAAALQQEVGQGAFTLNVSALKRWIFSGFNPDKAKPQEGDNLINYDWMQPASSTIATGANIASQIADKKRVNPLDVLGAALTSIEAGVQTLADQPVVQGLAKAFRGYNIVQSMTDALKGIPASFVPTLLNQAKQFVDNASRDSYNYNLTGMTGVDQSIAQVMNKIPGLSNLLPERVTTTGNVQQTYKAGMNNPITRLLNVTINPSFPSKYKADKGIQLVLNLYKNTGETKQFPQTTQKYININGKKFELTRDEQKQLQITVGKETVKQLNELAKDKGFDKLTGEEKVEVIADMLSSIGQYGKGVILQKYNDAEIEKRLTK